jgi:hypothetical protein
LLIALDYSELKVHSLIFLVIPKTPLAPRGLKSDNCTK